MSTSMQSNESRYDQSYLAWKSWGAGFGKFSKEEDVYFTGEIGLLEFCGNETATVLEIGFGNGTFLAWSKANGRHCDGLELNSALVNLGRSKGFSVYQQLDEIPEIQLYDLIVAFDVLEHIPDHGLPDFIASVASRLAPDGLILLRFPNGDSPFGRMYQNGDITHRSVIGSHKIRQLATLGGFSYCCTRAPYFFRGNTMLAKTKRRIIALMRCLIGIFISRLYFDGQDLELSPNLIAVLKK